MCERLILCPVSADPGGRAVYGVGLRLLACWDCGFESHGGHGCLCCVSCIRKIIRDISDMKQEGRTQRYKTDQRNKQCPKFNSTTCQAKMILEYSNVLYY
jgi:hypothetical protein